MGEVRRLVLFTCAVFASAWASPVHAVPLDNAFTSIPSRFETRNLTAGVRGLGELCLSRFNMPDGSVCNPAWLGEQEESFLMGQMFLGNGYAALSTANRFLAEPITEEFLTQLFQKDNVTSLEASLALSFTGSHFSAQFAPYRIQYVSEVHNPNLPVVAVHAALERGFTVSSGASFSGNWSAGIRTRFLERQYVHGSFSLFQAITEDPQTLLPVRKQTVLWFDPYLGWKYDLKNAIVRVSGGVVNLGKAWPSYSLYDEKIGFELGLGVEYRLPVGRAHFGVDWADELRLGGSYQFGMLEFMAGHTPAATTAGIQFGFHTLSAAVIYEFRRTDQLGGDFGTKIATEFTFRL